MNSTTNQTAHHTPGPYQIEDASENVTFPIYKVVKTGNGLRSVIASCADMALCEEHGGSVLANARLFAMAPALLDFVELVRAGNTDIDRLEELAAALVYLVRYEGVHP